MLYFWFQREGRTGGLHVQFYQPQSSATDFKLDEPSQVSFRIEDQMIFPPSGVVSLSDEGFNDAPSLCVKTAKEEIVLMFLRSPTAAPQVNAEKSSLSVLDGEETVTMSADENGVHCLGTISGPFKTAHIALNRNPNLPVYRDGFNGSVKSSVVRGLDLLSSTPGITVVGGFPFTASPESPCASEARSLVLAVNGRTSTAPSRP